MKQYRIYHELQLAANNGSSVPLAEWLRIFPFGVIKFIDGRPDMPFDRADAERIVAGFRARGVRLYADYHHQTAGKIVDPETGKVVKDYTAPDGIARAAGWITELAVRDDGLYARLDWTETATKLIAAREIGYYSPTFYRDSKTGRCRELAGIGLTNDPAIEGIPALAARQTNGGPAATAAGDSPEEEEAMDLMKELSALLGLAEGATAEDIVAKVKSMLGAGDAAETAARSDLGEIKKTLDLPETAGRSDVLGKILAFKSRPGEDLVKQVEGLKLDLAARNARDLVELAKAERKITPAQEPRWLELATRDPETFKAFMKDAVPVMPEPGAQVPESAGRDGAAPEAASAIRTEVHRQLGITPETWKKYGPPQA